MTRCISATKIDAKSPLILSDIYQSDEISIVKIFTQKKRFGVIIFSLYSALRPSDEYFSVSNLSSNLSSEI